jgi:hypothetical protein
MPQDYSIDYVVQPAYLSDKLTILNILMFTIIKSIYWRVKYSQTNIHPINTFVPDSFEEEKVEFNLYNQG